MVRTTPPRPVDLVTLFPELTAHARTTTRLHPRLGDPTSADSSFGGPLLWPAEELWPECGEVHPGDWRHAVWTREPRRNVFERRWERDSGLPDFIPDEAEAHVLTRIAAGLDPADGAMPLIPIMQLYMRDVPGLVGPPGADLLHVLWCPADHEANWMPCVRLFWRQTSEIGQVVVTPPVPTVIYDKEYWPEPCVLHPEQVTEYPHRSHLPDELRQQIDDWEDSPSNESGLDYQNDLSVAQGVKVGGWEPWSFRDPSPTDCGVCGSLMQPFIYIDSSEWDMNQHWMPLEDRIAGASKAPSINIGRSYGMQIYTCPASFDHPHAEVMQ